MNAKEAKQVLIGFVQNHIEAGSFWNDDTYEQEIKALAYYGDKKAAEAARRFYKSV